MEVAVLVSLKDVVDVEETGVVNVEEAGVVDVEDVADVEETGGADVEETGGADVGEASPSQLCLSSPMVLNIVVLWLPSPRFSPSHLNINILNENITKLQIRLSPLSKILKNHYWKIFIT